jgi:transcriptional regulator with XRE-family HTH domain
MHNDWKKEGRGFDIAVMNERGHIPVPHLRAWRQHVGMTRQALAARAGLTESTLAKLELGTTQGARQETVDKLARALRIRRAELLAGPPAQNQASTNVSSSQL